MATRNELIQKRIQANRESIEQLILENNSLEKQLASRTEGIEKWIDFVFESSSSLTEEFATFYKEIAAFLKQTLGKDFEVSVHRGHFDFSGFVQNKQTQKWAYFSTSDVRFFKNAWWDNLLIRPATGDEDFTGGNNQYIFLTRIHDAMLKLTK